ncbi:hypothetical protein Psta_4757 [Pirellula staleyi DSM 6068]|uniref:Uncharacterized protein n=1 Tax=Pirellula staleyi (strain ATCC 27377 / DSM 6068 / ICPB 4128) TaxID=530564 RepID=D2R8U8_PIRSD|nr:hypothetical protein Psta_4757 [Pirellula staleyi DSM 6068]
MCMFSLPVSQVANTRIFARLTGQGTQLLAYQMEYMSRTENAMILPLPVRQPAEEGSLRFIDFEKYDNFFDDLITGFPYIQRIGIGCSDAAPLTSESLDVVKVGNYIASFVPTLADFSRLDERFRLSPETWDKLPQYQDFSFAVFKLADGTLRPHPMAMEFQTASDAIFFPTVHVHDGETHPTERFDHMLYLQHAGLDSVVDAYRGDAHVDPTTGLVRSQENASQFCRIDQTAGLVDGNLLVHRRDLRGKHPNQDTIIAVVGHPTQKTFNFKSLWSYVPWVIFLSAMGWLFARRSKLKAA